MPASTLQANDRQSTRPWPLRSLKVLRILLPVLVGVLLTTGCDIFSPDEEEITYVAGETYYGRKEYIEYIAGDLPIILSAPHGGSMVPEEIPDRTQGTTVRDSRTEELARTFASTVHSRSGGYVHIIICRLRRTKLDANRDIDEAAQGNKWAEQAWHEYHDFIETAKQTVAETYGRGFYIDLHGHGHEIQRLELGYLLSSSDLELSDTVLNGSTYVSKSSIRTLANEADATFAELIRGPVSLGTLLEDLGYPAVPSTAQPNAGGAPYFTGGYSTQRHGSRSGGPISGVQIECNWTGVRSTTSFRTAFAQALAEALETYIETHYGFDLQTGPR